MLTLRAVLSAFGFLLDLFRSSVYISSENDYIELQGTCDKNNLF